MYLKNKTKYRLTERGRRYPIFFYCYCAFIGYKAKKNSLGHPWQKLLNIIANYDLAYK